MMASVASLGILITNCQECSEVKLLMLDVTLQLLLSLCNAGVAGWYTVSAMVEQMPDSFCCCRDYDC